MEVPQPNTSAQAGSPRAGCTGPGPGQGPGPGDFLISSRTETTQPLWVTCSNAVTLAVQKCFLMLK